MAPTNTCLFSAVSPAARDLTLLLRCIAFASKTQVRLSPEGLRFSAQETSVMEGKQFLYHYIRHMILTTFSLCLSLQISFHNLELPRSRSLRRRLTGKCSYATNFPDLSSGFARDSTNLFPG